MSDDRIEELLERLYDASDDDEIRSISREILKLDPTHPSARVALWTLKDEEEALRSVGDLEEALDEVIKRMGGRPEGIYDENPLTPTYGEALMHLAAANHSLERYDRAEACARDLVAFDPEEEAFPGRLILYRTLLDKGDWDLILDTYDQDGIDSPAGAHARAIALIEKDAPEGEIWEAVLEAFSLAPDLPFVILGLEALPDDEEGEYDQTFHQAAYLDAPWNSSDDRLVYLYLTALLVGVLTGRLEMDEAEDLEDLLREHPKGEALRRLITFGGPRPDEPSELDQWAIGKLMEVLVD
ncbi:hypothetical protein Taci_1695 [Thermanaerovibrio acidaminovorans DSM 6589]|uniref:TPR repeat-containing protein n=1 Tax=Thermanaerovibrio acidaminovorans (strain ATCC 49978 / DSM 6589 / Su883) TaxID=525903 RepID=D1B7B8_THEAS|nr:hypothetical protein [Thermanaerovibrio acidaminovorans]ACZ19909.1 hypothetical protein Taci_1695 [Thermanaerovibrio acidaminovorans DSM 6589]